MFVASSSVQCIRNIYSRPEIPYNIKALMVAIALNHDYKHSSEVGMQILSSQAGMSLRTAYRAFRRGEEIGVIEKKAGGKFSRLSCRLTTCDHGEIPV